MKDDLSVDKLEHRFTSLASTEKLNRGDTELNLYFVMIIWKTLKVTLFLKRE